MSDDASENESSDSEPVEWNVTQRSRRATAGNRLSSLLTQEGPEEDDDVQLLFKEDEEEPDEEFEDKASDEENAGGGDSSSSSEDEDEGNDELEGEKQLEREERAKKKQAKRKQEQAFMRPRASKPKRVKIAEPSDASTPDSDKDAAAAAADAAAAAQKKKKKSDRVSWLLGNDGHGPTRTSSRTLSLKNKERTQASLKQSEAKRKRQIAVMEAANKRRAAEKGKPLTQEDRLAEAARTEELNSMSLNRWEETERERLEKQRARLEALQNRKMEGPFIRWWSGRAEWEDDKLVHVGRRVKIEEVEEDEPEDEPANEVEQKPDESTRDDHPEAKPQEDITMLDPESSTMSEALHAANDTDKAQLSAETAVSGDAAQATEADDGITHSAQSDGNGHHDAKIGHDADEQPGHEQMEQPEEQPDRQQDEQLDEQLDERPHEPDAVDEEHQHDTDTVTTAKEEASGTTPTDNSQEERPKSATAEDSSAQEAADVAPQTVAGLQEAKSESETQPGPDQRAHSPPNEEGFLDGITQYAAMHDGDNDDAPAAHASDETRTPSAAQHQETGSVDMKDADHVEPVPGQQLNSAQPDHEMPTAQPAEPLEPERPTEPEKPKVVSYSSRQCVSLVNFSEPALGSLDTYRRVLFNWRSSQLNKPVKHAPQLCAITSQPAKYRDPTTGLAYRDIGALRRIKRITQEDAKQRPVWSQALGAWIGHEEAARGVPEEFLEKEDVSGGDKEAVKSEAAIDEQSQQ